MRSLLATLAVLAMLLPLRRYLLRGGRKRRKGLLGEEPCQEAGEGRTRLGTIDGSVGDIDDAVPLVLMKEVARIATYATHRATLEVGGHFARDGEAANCALNARFGE